MKNSLDTKIEDMGEFKFDLLTQRRIALKYNIAVWTWLKSDDDDDDDDKRDFLLTHVVREGSPSACFTFAAI